MAPTYFALLEDETTVIKKTSLDLISAVSENIKLIVKQELDSYIKRYDNEFPLFSYQSVDINGKPNPIELQNFIFIDLGTDDIKYNNKSRVVLVKEKHTGEIREFECVHTPHEFLPYFILPLIKRLENAGSLETLKKYEEIEILQKRNKHLDERVRQLEAELNNLRQVQTQ
jgi:hypothetical protein